MVVGGCWYRSSAVYVDVIVVYVLVFFIMNAKNRYCQKDPEIIVERQSVADCSR